MDATAAGPSVSGVRSAAETASGKKKGRAAFAGGQVRGDETPMEGSGSEGAAAHAVLQIEKPGALTNLNCW
jgi:hypothetical protein